MTFRIIDIESREVLKSYQAKGESKRQSTSLLGGGANSGGAGVGGLQMGSSNFKETILGEATIDCVSNLADSLIGGASTIPARFVDIEGSVARVSGTTLTINRGANHGVAVGDRFEISKVGAPIKDPKTGEVIDEDRTKIGELVIETLSANGNTATGTFKPDSRGTPETGNAATKKRP